MKKLILGIILAMTMVLAMVAPVMAADPTVVTVNWNGTGLVSGSSVVGAGAGMPAGSSFAESSFATFSPTGNIQGTYTVSTIGKTSYDVWGDLGPSTTATIASSVVNGCTLFNNASTGRTPYAENQHYNPVGSTIYASAEGAGTTSFDISSTTNHANMHNTSTGFNANSSLYVLQCAVTASPLNELSITGNYASFFSTGSGTANIDLAHSSVDYYGQNQVDFGNGAGCSTDADAIFTGVGSFATLGIGTNQVVSGMGIVANGTGIFGSAQINTITNFIGNTTIGNYSLNAR